MAEPGDGRAAHHGFKALIGFNQPDTDVREKIINGWMFERYLLIWLYIGVATVLGPQVTFGQLGHFHACGQDTPN